MTAIYDTLLAEGRTMPPVPPGHTRVQRITEAVYSGRSALEDTAPLPTITPVLLKRRPAVVEAIQVTEDNLHAVAMWCGERVHDFGRPGLEFHTDGDDQVHAHVGDWVIRGQLGQFYPAPDDAVWAGYERLIPVVSE